MRHKSAHAVSDRSFVPGFSFTVPRRCTLCSREWLAVLQPVPMMRSMMQRNLTRTGIPPSNEY